MCDALTLTWAGVYRESWKALGLLSPGSYAHPAKVAPGLALRLFDYGFAQGWWRKGDLVADPFMGICGFGIIAAYKGLRFVGVELEPRFHTLCLENVALHRRRWGAGGDPVPVCLQGDSRDFAALVSGAAAVVTSPPWGDVEPQNDKDFRAHHDSTGNLRGAYGTTPGQVGRLSAGDADAVVTSPPWAAQMHEGGNTPAAQGIGRNGRGQHPCEAKGEHNPTRVYGTTPGQVGALPAGDADAVVTSPPYESALAEGRASRGPGQTSSADPRKHGKRYTPDGATCLPDYGTTPGQVGALPAGDADAVMTSPPYEGSNVAATEGDVGGVFRSTGCGPRRRATMRCEDYGTVSGQVGRERGETYWGAVKCIYGQCLLALRSGGVLCCVVKDFVRNKARVPLCDQTWRLLLSLGFLPVARIRCLLSEETREPSLFGGDCVRKRQRKSFFRLLAEKNGSPVIDAEEILVARRP